MRSQEPAAQNDLTEVERMKSHASPAEGAAPLSEQLERSQRDLEDFFENAVVPLHWVGSDGSILRANQAELDLLGYTRDEYVGRQIAEFHADAPVIADILTRLSSGEKLHKCEARLKAKDGTIRHVLISSSVHFREGKFVNTRCFTLDVTDLRKAETALRESERRLRATHERAFAGIAEIDLDGRFLHANARFYELTGYGADELATQTFVSITHPDDAGADRAAFAALVAGETDKYNIEKRILRKDGTEIWVALSASLVRDDDGRPLCGIRVLQDISGIKRSEARQKLLLDELNHRVKNMLATVQSVAMHTRRNATDLDAFTGAFEGRLMALNRAHDLLTRELESGGALLHDLVRDTLAPFEVQPGERVSVDGPVTRLGSEMAVTLAMALHELTINAAKYGALSAPEGRISVAWRVEDSEHMVIDWAESGGPSVAPPARRGFGSELIERALARQFGGSATLEFAPGGLRCRITAPLQRPRENLG